MTIQSRGHEHEFEPEYGLPEALPVGERILWQGSPDFATVARRVFHVRKFALYFALWLGLRVANTVQDGGTLVEGLMSITVLALMAAMGLLALSGTYPVASLGAVVAAGVTAAYLISFVPARSGEKKRADEQS